MRSVHERSSIVVIGATTVDRARLAAVCERYGVAKLSVFGSAARSESRAHGDVDLLYVLAPGRHLGFSINRLEDELSELLGCPVDLVSRSALHRAIRDDVLADARPLYPA
jgi:predicted nucleotidyltransferase